MTSKITNKFSPEVRARAVRMVLDHASEHPSRWAVVTSIATKIGCTPQTLHDWVKKAEVDSGYSSRRVFDQNSIAVGKAWRQLSAKASALHGVATDA